MLICIIIAGALALLNIFSFFGYAVSDMGPNMFNVMFGTGSYFEGYWAEWKQFETLTFLFVLQIIIMIAAVVGFVICYKIKYDYEEETKGIIISIVMAIMSLIAAIISFNTANIMDVDLELGFGSLFYAIVNIVIILILIAGIVIEKLDISTGYSGRPTPQYTPYKAPTYQNPQVHNPTPVRTTPTKTTLSEQEKVELILKYKKLYDDGVITLEEYEKKKKELL